jgi:hypothetical protein
VRLTRVAATTFNKLGQQKWYARTIKTTKKSHIKSIKEIFMQNQSHHFNMRNKENGKKPNLFALAAPNVNL